MNNITDETQQVPLIETAFLKWKKEQEAEKVKLDQFPEQCKQPYTPGTFRVRGGTGIFHPPAPLAPRHRRPKNYPHSR